MVNQNQPISETHPIDPENSFVQKKELDRQSLAASTSNDHARPDLNVPRSADPRVPDMNEGEEHLAATGAGTLGGAAVGATLGAVGGPPGALVGGAIGGIVGGLAGSDIAHKEHVDPLEREDHYWRESYLQKPYYQDSRNHYPDLDYDRDYQNAYRLGYESRMRLQPETRFDDVEHDLQTQWEQFKGESRLKWEEAKFAVKDAWNRITH